MVVVHQRLVTRKFDLRDRLVVHKADLTPLHPDTDRSGAPHVYLDYAVNTCSIVHLTPLAS